MTIFKEIYDLLYNNDCVIVPEFGAFVLKSHSAYIKDDTFYPPRKVISFNVMLDENDGLLVKHLSNSRNISYKKALKTINYETQSLKNELSADKKISLRYTQGGIGYGEAKEILYSEILNKYDTNRKKFFELMVDKQVVEDLLIDGAKKARAQAQKVLKRVRANVGY